MDDRYAIYWELRVNFGADLAHFRIGHRFVGFVVEIERWLTLEIVADEAVEHDQRAVAGRFQSLDDFLRANRGAHNLENVSAGSSRLTFAGRRLLSAAHWRQKCHLVTARKLRAPCRVFLID